MFLLFSGTSLVLVSPWPQGWNSDLSIYIRSLVPLAFSPKLKTSDTSARDMLIPPRFASLTDLYPELQPDVSNCRSHLFTRHRKLNLPLTELQLFLPKLLLPHSPLSSLILVVFCFHCDHTSTSTILLWLYYCKSPNRIPCF